MSAAAKGGELEWLWLKPPGKGGVDAPAEKIWLRRTFELPASGAIPKATLYFAVDNSADVYVNGTHVGHFGGWKPTQQQNITNFLRRGKNVVAIEADNAEASPAGFLGLIDLAGDKPLQIPFDEQTKAARFQEDVTDWKNPDFDDSKWVAATEVVPADWGPWGRISEKVENPTLQEVPANFPKFAVPGFEKEMEKMRQLYFGHFRMDLSNLPAFNIQWVAPSAIWAALGDDPADSHVRESLKTRLQTMRAMEDGYVSCHQHEGLGHSEGWPFPLYTQGNGAGWLFSIAGLPYGPEFGLHPAKSADDWEFRHARPLSLDSGAGLRLALTAPDASMTSPPIEVIAPVATWIRIKLVPGDAKLSPSIQWTTKEHPEFSDERKVAFEIPEPKSPGQPVDVDIPIHPITKMEGTLTRLRVNFGNAGEERVTILRLFTTVDTRHNWNNANFVLAAATYFNWTGDVDFLREFMPELRRIFNYSMEEFQIREKGVLTTPWAGKDGVPGLTLVDGKKVIRPGLGAGTNYWDLMPFGGKDGLSSVYQYAAIDAMAQLEKAIASHPDWNIPAPKPEYSAERLERDLEKMRETYQKTFWDSEKGRFVGAIDLTGKAWDFGYTFVNNEAMHYGIASPEQARQIVDWISGKRIIEGETSTGEDIYRFRFGPRSSTMRNIEYYAYVWPNPEAIPFGRQVQDGGSVFGFSFHDLMGRLNTNGPDDAWNRLKEILAWYGDVQKEGGYRKYYTPDKAEERGTLQGGGPPGGLGIDEEFYETILVPQILTEGFLGMAVTPESIRFNPRLPSEWPSLEVGSIQYRDWLIDALATKDSLTLTLESTGKARPITVDLPAGPWQVRLLRKDGSQLSEQTIPADGSASIDVANPETTQLIATRPAL